MIEVENEKCRVVVDDDGALKLYQKGEHPFQKICSTPEGGLEFHSEPTTESERELVAVMSRYPVFVVTYGGKTDTGKTKWYLDCEAGVQRYMGTCTTHEILRALGKYLVPTQDKRRLLKECRKHEWDHGTRWVS